jgi:hypothetical protein
LKRSNDLVTAASDSIELNNFTGKSVCQPSEDMEAFDDDCIMDELLLSAVMQYENQQNSEAATVNDEQFRQLVDTLEGWKFTILTCYVS